jgi:hypothetical protein
VILLLVCFPGPKVEVEMLDLLEEISPLRCLSLLPYSDWLHCQQAARFFDFVFSSYDLNLQVILQKLPGLSMSFYSKANQLEGAWCLSVVLRMHEDVQHYR